MTITYHHSWLLSHMTYSSITITYDLWSNPQNHHLWLIIHNSSHMSMTSHPWLLDMTIIHDHLDSWLSSMTSLTYDYQDCYLWPSLITYHLWPLLITMTYDYHLSHLDLSPMTMLLIHDLSHVTPDYVFLYWPMTYDHHLWPMTYDLWHMTMTYDHHLSPLTTTYHP